MKLDEIDALFDRGKKPTFVSRTLSKVPIRSEVKPPPPWPFRR